MINIGIAIALLILCSSYKSCPIVSKLTGIKVLTIILTVLTSINILVLLSGILPMYYFTESDGYYPIVSELISGILVAITIYAEELLH